MDSLMLQCFRVVIVDLENEGERQVFEGGESDKMRKAETLERRIAHRASYLHAACPYA